MSRVRVPSLTPQVRGGILAPLTFFFDEALQRYCNASRHVLLRTTARLT
jgi:hypothetical protein